MHSCLYPVNPADPVILSRKSITPTSKQAMTNLKGRDERLTILSGQVVKDIIAQEFGPLAR
jgi:hypothetical protein